MLPAPATQEIYTDHLYQAQRDPEEEGDYMAFEQLMAEATAKKEKETKHKKHEKPEKHGKHEKEPTTAEAAA